MGMEVITSYRAYWNPEKNYGILTMLYGTTYHQQRIESPQEMLLFLDILRNEKPVWFVPDAKAIVTGTEPVGEEET